jgi:hypothetical protein
MDRDAVKAQLIAVVEHIQRTTDNECPPITADPRPMEDLKGFDSKVCPVSLLGAKLGVPLDNKKNIFRKGRRPLSVDEVVEQVYGVISSQMVSAGAPTQLGVQ